MAVLLLCLSHPLIWATGQAIGPVGLWSAPAGLGLVLVAWFGWRFSLTVSATAGLFVVLRVGLIGSGEAFLTRVSWALSEVALGTLEPLLAWWLYRGLARGSRQLADPRSATQFVFLVPGLAAGLIALARAALWWWLVPTEAPASRFLVPLAVFWMEHALGMLVVAPPLLALVTPWLARRGLLCRESLGVRTAVQTIHDPAMAIRGPGAADPDLDPSGSAWGDWLEIAGLAAGAGILCLVMSGLWARREPLGEPLWGVQLLLVVWASLRQGLPGGTLVAGTAALVPQLFQIGSGGDEVVVPLLFQAHLLAQSCAAVLVAAGASWARLHEAGYRRVVGHIPVVIYSARLRAEPGAVATGWERLAEVTLVSAASERLLGCPAEQLLGDYSHWLARIHPDDRVVLQAAVTQLTRQQQPVTCEYRLQVQGAARWLRDTLAPRRAADGRVVGWDGVVSDITEQRVLADDLRRTTSMFHALVANLPAGVFFVQGPQGTPIIVNSRARQLLGQREDAAAGLEYLSRVYQLFRPDGTPYPAEELPVYLALRYGRTTMRDDIVVHRPDGRRVPLVTWAAPVQLGPPRMAEADRTGSGSDWVSPFGSDAAVWVLEDLTALHQAEAARQESDTRLRAIIETMAEGLLVLDPRGRIVSSNPAADSFFGVGAGELLGRSLAELDWTFLREDGTPLPAEMHPAVPAQRHAQPVRNVLVGAHPRRRASDAGRPPTRLEIRWLLVNAMPLAGWSAGRVLGLGDERPNHPVVITFSDLTAYVHATESTRISEERYRGLVESLPMMLLQSDRNLRVTYTNPATRTISGYELQEIADPTAWASIIHPEDVGRVYEMAHGALAGRSDRGEFRYRAKDGSEKVAYALVQPRVQDGEVVGATTFLLDTTRERQLERELQRSQQLELIGRLSSGVAHDFNNLLAVVLSLTDLARGHLPEDHPLHENLKQISAAGEQAAGLAAQLLSFGKQRAGANGLNGSARRIDLRAVLRRTLELLRATLPATIRLETDLAEDELTALGDETQVQQVLMNLCLNARDAMPRGGVLRVAVWREGPTDVRLTVEDSGAGMSEEVRQRIFEPYFSTKEAGTGLGLAVVQQIVASFGGQITVHSRPGEGTRFDIRWPVCGAE